MSLPSTTNTQSTLDHRIAQLEGEILLLKGQLAQVEKDRDEYLQNVSHQIVAPLNAMKWHMYLPRSERGRMGVGGGICLKSNSTLYGTQRNLLGSLAACWKPKSFKAAKSVASRSQRLRR